MDHKYEKPEHMPFYHLERDLCEEMIKNDKYAPEEISGAIGTQLEIARQAIEKARRVIEDWLDAEG